VVYSSGRITALWLVLRTLSNFGNRSAISEVISYASRSSLRSGGLPVKDGFRLAILGGFARESGEECQVAELGLTALKLSDEDEPTDEVRRLLISTLILRHPPAWVAYWQGDPGSLDLLLKKADRELLDSAGLLPPPGAGGDLRRRAWWLALGAVPLPEELYSLRKAIGDAGEELSYRHEKARLTAQGFPKLADEVSWVARESAAYGFDIASYAGSSFRDRDPNSPLAIEVKSVSYPVRAVFPLHITTHEWSTAQELNASYVFHLWSAVRTGPEVGSGDKEPRLIVPDDLRPHMAGASPCGGRCRWDSMLVELPLIPSSRH
jgi:hypothetical protein